MPTFKQKNVIKSYKLRLLDKLKTVTEETEKTASCLNSCVAQFKNRVQYILEIKDEKCLSLYRKLKKDLDDYSEKIFILRASFGATEEDTSEDESPVQVPKFQPKPLVDLLAENDYISDDSVEESMSIDTCREQNVNSQKHPQENLELVRHSEENLNLLRDKLSNFFHQRIDVARHPEESLNLQRYPDGNVDLSQYLEKKHLCLDDEDDESVTEDDYYSLHSDNNIHNTNNTTLIDFPLEVLHAKAVPANDCVSNISVSQSSCYRSISSNISESLPLYKENKNSVSCQTYPKATYKCSLESCNVIPVEFEISSKFSSTLSYIIDPSDFWIQTENSHGFKLRFPKSEYAHLNSLSSIKSGQHCLAPFKSTPFYYRAKSFTNANSGRELVKVQFIDHGSTQEVFLCDLRSLPTSAYEISAQAINCYLYGIAPTDDSWSEKSVERFKEFQNCCIETIVKSKDHLYGVQLVAKLSADSFTEDYSVDIAQALCLDGLAISLNEIPSSKKSENLPCIPPLSKPVDNKTESSLEISGSYDINAISSDSGVSVASAYKSNQICSQRHELFSKVSVDCVPTVTVPYDENVTKCNQIDLISFESFYTLNDKQNSDEEIKVVDNSPLACPKCRNKNFCLHLKVPSPQLLFVEENMVIVMISHIVNPHEFYVNMAMENIEALDDLREQMTSTYESQKNIHCIKLSDLTENLFCAGRFDADNYWYRVKILQVTAKDKENKEVLGQYIDYGNTATIKCSNLKPLSTEFSKYPCFAIKCSLAGVNPVKDKFSSKKYSYWNEDAVEVFKKLTSSERCYTAQICNDFCKNQNDTYSVLLWDTTNDSKDLLINKSLAEHKVATFNLYSSSSSEISENTTTNHAIDAWDPMSEEYVDSHNSYAVDDEDIEVATTGYHAKDEEYTCKYFALRGFCPRGKNCQYEHLPLLESGITRDQEEVYCLDTVPIVSDSVNNILVQVSAIISPSHFYVVLPFGCKTVDDIDDLVFKGSTYAEIINSEAKALFFDLNKHYSNSPFKENTTIALSCGSIVVAKRKWDGKWHRGRVIDVVGIDRPAKVFFVDSGDQEWVSRKFIRTILPQFLYTPFQAVQCNLHGIEPAGSDKKLSWSSEALNYFKDIVSGEILLAEIVHRFGQVFHVSLRKTSRMDHKTVAQHLVSAGFARYHTTVQREPSIKQTIYVPG